MGWESTFTMLAGRDTHSLMSAFLRMCGKANVGTGCARDSEGKSRPVVFLCLDGRGGYCASHL